MRSPDLMLHRDESGLSVVNLFSRVSHLRRPGRQEILSPNFSIFAPQIIMTDGRVLVDPSVNTITDIFTARFALFTNLNASFFVESLENQQFIEISSFTANTNVDDFNGISLNAQLFTNGESLELNGLDIRTESAVLQMSAEAAPVNIFEPDVEESAFKCLLPGQF